MKYLALMLALVSFGCTHRVRNERVDIDVPATAITGDVHLLDCDLHTEPPKCKSVRMTYRRQLALIKIGKDTPSQ